MEPAIQSQREALRRTSPVEFDERDFAEAVAASRGHHTRLGRTQRILFRPRFPCSEQRAARALHSRQPPKIRIQRAAGATRYRPNLFARSLRGGAAIPLASWFSHDRSRTARYALRGIENTLYQSSFLPDFFTDVHKRSEPFRTPSGMLLSTAHQTGLVSSPTGCSSDIDLAGRSGEDTHSDRGGRAELKNDNISSVIVDNNLGAPGGALTMFVFALGHRKIGLSAGPRQLSTPNREPRRTLRWPVNGTSNSTRG